MNIFNKFVTEQSPKEKKQLLTFISPLLSAVFSLYPSISVFFDSFNVGFSLAVFFTFFLSLTVFISMAEITIKVIYFKYFPFLRTDGFVAFIFTLMSFIATGIAFMIMFYEEGMPDNFFNSLFFAALLIAYFGFLLISLLVSYVYILIDNNKKFLLISFFILFILLFLVDRDSVTFVLLASFITLLGGLTIAIIRKIYASKFS